MKTTSMREDDKVTDERKTIHAAKRRAKRIYDDGIKKKPEITMDGRATTLIVDKLLLKTCLFSSSISLFLSLSPLFDLLLTTLMFCARMFGDHEFCLSREKVSL